MDKYGIEDITEFADFLDIVSDLTSYVQLYRGQSNSDPLLPKIARNNPKENTLNLEKTMLEELWRRGSIYIGEKLTDLELLVYGQHHGLATRLLDWTENPLAALWFACRDISNIHDCYVYNLIVNKNDILTIGSKTDPFKVNKTKVYKPIFNNPRIIAQTGWFTLHRYSKSAGKFVALEKNPNFSSKIVEIQIKGTLKEEILYKLDTLGINDHTLFPDLVGLCTNLNWYHKVEQVKKRTK